MHKSIGVLLAASMLQMAAPASAQVVAGFDSNTLAANDDSSSARFSLPFEINFFGNSYSGLYVNNNGNVTFTAPQTNFTPTGLGASYSGAPVIAPFFADVDTRGAGSGVVTYGMGSYNGYETFGATWNNVGYYAQHADKLNTFQLLLVNRADLGTGDFDILFNYGAMGWETGDASGGRGGLGGTSAAVGYNAGAGSAAGSYFQAAGSLQNGAFLTGGSNPLSNTRIGALVREGDVVAIETPTAAVPEPASWAMMMAGFGVLGGSMRRRKLTRRARFAAA